LAKDAVKKISIIDFISTLIDISSLFDPDAIKSRLTSVLLITARVVSNSVSIYYWRSYIFLITRSSLVVVVSLLGISILEGFVSYSEGFISISDLKYTNKRITY
jgi:hypothetical protein